MGCGGVLQGPMYLKVGCGQLGVAGVREVEVGRGC